MELLQPEVVEILVRVSVAGLIGGLIGYERRVHHKAALGCSAMRWLRMTETGGN